MWSRIYIKKEKKEPKSTCGSSICDSKRASLPEQLYKRNTLYIIKVMPAVGTNESRKYVMVHAQEKFISHICEDKICVPD